MAIKEKLKLWIKAVRAPFFTATIIPILLGTAIAWSETNVMHWGLFILTLLGGVLIHAGVNLINDYYDHRSRNDWVNETPTPFSGGSRVIQNQSIKPAHILYTALICFGLGAIIGLLLNFMLDGTTLIVIGVIGILLGFFYTATPVKIGYRGYGLGELSVGLGFGPLMVLGSYYVQSAELSWYVFWASIPVMILIALVVYINEFPDYKADKSVNKRTLPVMLGKKKAAYLFYGLLVFTYVYTVFFIAIGIIPLFVLLILGTVPLADKIIKVTMVNKDKIYELLPANATTILLHLLFGACMIIGYIINGFAS